MSMANSLTPQTMVLSSSPSIRRSGRKSTDNVVSSPQSSQISTQAAPILEGVTVWVEYRDNHVNQTAAIQNLARELGARVKKTLTVEVTHVIFKDGSLAMFKKAKKRGLKILNMMWLDESKKAGKKLPESDFPTVSSEKYSSPGLFPKIRKKRSMQPKSLEEESTGTTRAKNRRIKALKKKYASMETEEGDQVQLSPKTPRINIDSPLEIALSQLQSPNGSRPRKLTLNSNLPPSPPSPSDKDLDTALGQKLVKKFQASEKLQASPAAPPSPPPAKRRSGRATTQIATLATAAAHPSSTISHYYRLPKKEELPEELYDMAVFILEQNLEVSPLNRAYRGHTIPPTKEARDTLKKDFGTSWGNYHEVEDSAILRRLGELEAAGVVKDRVRLCHQLRDHCGRRARSRPCLGIRNILGLWVGQDIPHKIAFLHVQRMVALIEGSSITYQVGVLAFSGYTIRSDLADLGLIFGNYWAEGLIFLEV